MSISIDPNSASSAPSIDALDFPRSQSEPNLGIANSPSSLASYGDDEDFAVGFYAWLGGTLGSIWRSIRIWIFGEPVIEAPLDKRIKMGVETLEEHFRNDIFSQVDENRTVVSTLIKYNDQSAVVSGKLSVEGSVGIKADGIIGLRRLLANRRCDNGVLQIKTFVFVKNDDETFNVHQLMAAGTEASGMVMTRSNLSNLRRAALYLELTRAISSGVDRQRVISFVLDQVASS